ncbi:serine protease SPPA, chloroplastic-like isoform X3 [Prosopis cineraria]|uniref:serine protease SPPA, chloroplastic-like isoform X3 n=1 Tax=Prosopis cineraria TaxID=364024 RepID=UPI00240F386E|nr:serine protease SPPA, chloroplastic-like isoform X3 [Prosopis cineraria]
MWRLLLFSSRRSSLRRSVAIVATLSSSSSFSAPLSHFPFQCRLHLSLPSHSQSFPPFLSLAFHFSSSSFDSKPKQELVDKDSRPDGGINNPSARIADEDYPSGDFDFAPIFGWRKFLLQLKMLIAFPLEGVRKGSVLTMKLRGRISDQLKSPFSQGLSLPQICENFSKAAYDPRISGIYLHIDKLNCGWGKVEEIQRQILNFKRSGKFVVAYVPSCQEKEYYLACACEEIYAPPSAYFSLFGFTVQASFLRGVLDNIGIEPQVERIGKYKSAGDQLTRRTMSEETCEMLTALLDNIYTNWLDKVSSSRGIKREEIENFINEGVYQVDRLKEEGFITNIMYEDEVIAGLRGKLRLKTNESLRLVDYRSPISFVLPLVMVLNKLCYFSGKVTSGNVQRKSEHILCLVRKYCRVRRWTVGISGGKDLIAIIRASGSISRVKSSLSLSRSGIIAEQFIEKIRKVRVSKQYKAAIIRIDSPGGDALASDLMWREIRLLAASKPVIASLSDVAASGGYYMAMGAGAIVAENLTLTGSIGVFTGRFNLGKLYEKIGFNKEIISRGKYAEVLAAEQRPFRPDEAELFAKSAQHIYKQFRDKAAFSRSMTVERMEEVAQGRVWSGKAAASHGLVDAIGGLSRAIAIAKLKANIPQDRQVTLVELSRPSLAEILSGAGNTLAEVDNTLKELLQDLTFSDGVQARMDAIMLERLEGYPCPSPILRLMKDFLSSL